MDIPEYYRQFQSTVEQPVEEKKKDKAPEQKTGQQKPGRITGEKDKTVPYQADAFSINRLEDWKDITIYTLTGPVTDGIQHNLIITVEKDVPFDNVFDYAQLQIRTLEQELKGCTLLKKGDTKLTNQIDAYEAIFKWFPTQDICIYQHQVFVLVEKTAYKMTASFTKKTLQTLGPQVERMMLSFEPSASKK